METNGHNASNIKLMETNGHNASNIKLMETNASNIKLNGNNTS